MYSQSSNPIQSNPCRINGEKQHGGFDGVEGEVYPCAGSYRTGVMIRLLKVSRVLQGRLTASVSTSDKIDEVMCRTPPSSPYSAHSTHAHSRNCAAVASDELKRCRGCPGLHCTHKVLAAVPVASPTPFVRWCTARDVSPFIQQSIAVHRTLHRQSFLWVMTICKLRVLFATDISPTFCRWRSWAGSA